MNNLLKILHKNFVIARFLSSVLLKIKQKRRVARADAQLPDALSLLGSGLKAGLSLPQALEMAANEAVPPLGEDLSLVIARIKLGETIEDALHVLEERVPTEDIGLMVQSIDILRKSGGNMIETFAVLASTIEERRRVADKIRALTAQGVMQAAILLALPWALAAALGFMAPDFISPLFHTRMGVAFLLFAIFLEILGALWLRNIVIIKV